MAKYPAPIDFENFFNSENFLDKSAALVAEPSNVPNFNSMVVNTLTAEVSASALALTVTNTATVGTLAAGTVNCTGTTTVARFVLPTRSTVNTGAITQGTYTYGLITAGTVSSTSSPSVLFALPATPTGVYFYKLLIKSQGIANGGEYLITSDPSLASGSRYSPQGTLTAAESPQCQSISGNPLKAQSKSNPPSRPARCSWTSGGSPR